MNDTLGSSKTEKKEFSFKFVFVLPQFTLEVLLLDAYDTHFTASHCFVIALAYHAYITSEYPAKTSIYIL